MNYQIISEGVIIKNVTQESNKLTSKDNYFLHLLDFLNIKSFKGDSVDNYNPYTKVSHEGVAKKNINNNEKTIMPVNDNNIIIEATLAVLKGIGAQIKLTEEQLQSLIKEYKYFITNFLKIKNYKN